MRDKNSQFLTSSMAGTTIPASTMLERLQQHESNIPDKILYILLEDGINEKDSITYAEIVTMARAIGTKLQEKGEKGDRVLLLFPNGIEFITAFYGCLFAGMIAVPTYPPKRNKANERFKSIVNDSTPACILSTRDIHDDLLKHELLSGLPEFQQLLIYDEITPEMAGQWLDPGISEDDLALLQYTSGSTGTPNGVMVSHGNMIHNSECIKQSFGFDQDSVGVNWLPNFHDMGLIGGLIQAAYLGASNVIIPPLAFLKNPANWYRAITNYKATTGGGPNFAFDYSIEKVLPEEMHEFDLSSLRTLYCGAEPIRANTMKNFVESFTNANFKAKQLFPVYGMAETVLIVTGGDYNAEPIYLNLDARSLEDNKVVIIKEGRESRTLTANGYPWLGMEVVIVDPAGKTFSLTGKIGEIWVKGPSVAKGYWNDPEATKKTFHAYISNTNDGPWLRTGDMGFIHNGQLYVSGRIKDLIIIRGLNYFPNDIEHSTDHCHDALMQNSSAAFSSDIDGQEQLVVLAEVKRAFVRELPEDEVFEAIRQAVFEEHGIQAFAIALLRTGSTLKTSSGKIQRFAMKNAWLNDELNVLASWEMKADEGDTASEIGFRPEFLREWMINWMAQTLELDPGKIDPDKPVSAYGLDSIKAVSLERDVNKQFGVEWPIESFLKENTINELVEEGIQLLRNKSSNSKF